jgi:hypothetical protein
MAGLGNVPRPFVARVNSLYCAEANRESANEEPYLLIATIDMLAALTPLPVALGMPSVHVVRVGPWAGVHAGSQLPAPAAHNPHFWDLDGQPRPVAAPHDVLFLTRRGRARNWV